MNANTPQGTGAMTLDQGVAAVKASLAAKGATVEDTAIIHPENPDEADALTDEFGEEAIVQEGAEESGQEENAEAVSEDESGESQQKPDDRPVILPDGSQITVEEARKGYLRQSEFTRKTQDIARKAADLTARETAVANHLGSLIQQVASLQETEPTPQQMYQLRQQDAARYEEVKAYWDYRRPILQQAKDAYSQTQANALAVQSTKARESLLAGDYGSPWKDKPKELDAGLTTIRSYMTDRFPDFDQALLDGVVWPEAIIVMEESRKYRELQKAQPKAALAVKGKPKPFVPGSKTAASPQSETIRALQEAFRNKPNVDNATALQKAKAAYRR